MSSRERQSRTHTRKTLTPHLCCFQATHWEPGPAFPFYTQSHQRKELFKPCSSKTPTWPFLGPNCNSQGRQYTVPISMHTRLLILTVRTRPGAVWAGFCPVADASGTCTWEVHVQQALPGHERKKRTHASHPFWIPHKAYFFYYSVLIISV